MVVKLGERCLSFTLISGTPDRNVFVNKSKRETLINASICLVLQDQRRKVGC